MFPFFICTLLIVNSNGAGLWLVSMSPAWIRVPGNHTTLTWVSDIGNLHQRQRQRQRRGRELHRVTSRTTKGNLNVSAGLEDSNPTDSSHPPPTKTKIKLFSYVECTKSFHQKFLGFGIQCNYHVWEVGPGLSSMVVSCALIKCW